MTDFIGTAGDDHFKGTDAWDHFDLSQGGADWAQGSKGSDTFYMGAAYDSSDTLVGGAGVDTIELNGDYGPNLIVSGVRIERIVLDGGHSYDLDVYASREGMTVDASSLGPDDALTLDGHTGYGLVYYAGAGHNVLIGGDGGTTFIMGANLKADDVIVAGKGFSVVDLNGDYSSGLVMTDTTLQHIQFLGLSAGHDYDLTLARQSGGNVFHIDGASLGASDHLILDGALAKRALHVDGGSGADTLIGGSASDQLRGGVGDDKLVGGAGGDQLTGGVGDDRFFFLSASDSTAANPDTILDLLNNDTIYLKPIDADVTATGNQAFHLANAFHGVAGELVVSFASGVTTMAGDVDGDGVADLVIRVSGDHQDFHNFVL